MATRSKKPASKNKKTPAKKAAKKPAAPKSYASFVQVLRAKTAGTLPRGAKLSASATGSDPVPDLNKIEVMMYTNLTRGPAGDVFFRGKLSDVLKALLGRHGIKLDGLTAAA